MAIAIIFSITWLPLNVLNLVIDIYNPFSSRPEDEEKLVIIYAVCHLFGMSSACANPVLYGWFNDNFRSEFTKILSAPFRRLCYCFYKTGSSISSAPAQSSSSATFSPEVDGYPAVQQQGIELRHQSTIDMTVEGNNDEWAEPSSGNDNDKSRVTTTNETDEMITRIPLNQSSLVDVELVDPSPRPCVSSFRKSEETHL